ncbi:unnamed protein product, partial [Musa acuminata subsp. burmannicoides]
RAGRSTTGSHGTPYVCLRLLVWRCHAFLGSSSAAFLPSLSVVSVGKL